MSVFTIRTFIFIYTFLLLQSHSAGDFYFAEVPETVTAPVGSCLQIPCMFNISGFNLKLKKTRHIHGIWQKNPTVEATQCGVNCVPVFNSSNNIIGGSSEIQMIGNLSERNCTTVFYNITKSQTGAYFFRLESKSFTATFNTLANNPDITKFKPVKIKVTDSPSRPKLQLMGGEETVMEGSTVTLRCSAEASCPQVSWSNVPESADVKPQRLETKPDGTQWVFSEVTFTASHVDHQANVSCTVTYPRATSTETVTLRVSSQYTFPVAFGCTSGALAFILLTGIFIFCKRRKSPTEQAQTAARKSTRFCQSDDVISSAENETDELNYGEIDFCNLQCEQREAEREPEASVYSEVHLPDRNKASRNDTEDVYAQVTKK